MFSTDVAMTLMDVVSFLKDPCYCDLLARVWCCVEEMFL